MKPAALRSQPYWLLAAFIAVMLSPVASAPAALIAVAVGLTAIRAARFLAAHRARSAAPPAGAIVLGADGAGRKVLLGDRELSAHGLILGASGAGKSTTLLRILTDQIRRGRPVVAIDLKGSPDFARELDAAARAAGRPFKIWSLDGPCHWNPLEHGNATELKDKLIATERFTEPHYQRAAERYVQIVLQVLQHRQRDPTAIRDGAVTLEEVVALMDPRRLPSALRGLPRPLAERIQDYVAGLTPDQLSAVRGLQTRLAIVTESHIGQYLSPPAGSAPDAREKTIDLREALRGPDVVLFSLNSSKYGRLAAQVGTLVVQDLVSAAGDRLSQGAAPPSLESATIGIDEFSALGADHVLALLARGRAAGMGTVLATQELADLDRAAAGLRDQVLGNTAVKIAHRQEVPASALTFAEIAGTEKVWEETRQIGGLLLRGYDTGRGTRRQVERFVIDPNQIKNLPTGDAVVISKLTGRRARTVHVARPQRDGPELG